MFRAKSPVQSNQTILTLTTEPTVYPVGTFLHTEKGYFYIVSQTRRLRIVSERVLRSWAPNLIVSTTEAAVRNYKVSSRLKFRNGSLIKDVSDGKVYLVEEGQRRHIVSPDVYHRLSIRLEDVDKFVLVVSQDEIKLHSEGEALS